MTSREQAGEAFTPAEAEAGGGERLGPAAAELDTIACA